MRSRFQIEVEEARLAARRVALARHSRNYRARQASRKAPTPRDVQRQLWELLTRSDGWDSLANALVVELAKKGLDPVATKTVIDRMMANGHQR
jgi:ATP-dependent 26S proteasome regulatory subunit